LHKKLNILITVDPEIPVPPHLYGGIERIVDMLVCGLAERGHQIHLFAHGESKTAAKLIPYCGQRSGSLKDTLINALQIKDYIKEIGGVDIIHSFSRLAYLFFLLKSPIPKIQSYQRYITARSVYLGTLLAGKTLSFTACSRYCAGTADFAGGRWTIIPNGVIIEKYRFHPAVSSDAPLVYLGRIERIKGVHTAIAVSKKTGRRLIIAGNYEQGGKNYSYFSKEILPHCDGERIKYVGAVDDLQKNELLGRAAALLFPIEWGEAFGIVMVEALACGTPVIAFDRAAVREIIKDKVTGFICNSLDEMAEAVKNVVSIERVNCRRQAERYFSGEVITAAYEALYYSRIQGCKD